MEPPREHLPGIQEDQVWEEKVEKILQIPTGVEKISRINLDQTKEESQEAKGVAGNIKEKRNQEGDIEQKRRQEGERTETGEIGIKAKERGETEAVGEKGTQRRTDLKVVSTCVIVRMLKS